MLGKNDNEKPTSILTRVGNTVSGVGGFLSKGVKVLAKGAMYPIWPKNWVKSWGEVWHDIKNGGRHIIGKPLEEYDSPIETTKASENLGVKITEQKKGTGKVSFVASKTLTGDIPYLSQEQLDQIKQELSKKFSNVTVFREENKVVIEIDVEGITNVIKSDNKGESQEKIKELVLKAIYKEVDDNLKGLAKITGGELKVHTDRDLLHGIAEKLYREYESQNKSSEATVSHDNQKTSETAVPDETITHNNMTKKAIAPNDDQKKQQISETAVPDEIVAQSNLTNPFAMYHLQPGVTAGEIRKQESYEKALRGQDIKLDASNLQDVSSETLVSPPSTPSNSRKNGGGPSIN